MIILNTLFFVSLMIFYSLVIVGYGAKFKSLFFENDINSIGEFGIYGFIFLYFLSILIHFVLPINFIISFIILPVGIYFFFKKLTLNKING